MWPYARHPYGYGKFQQQLVHRLVCEASHGAPPLPRMDAAHSCGNGHLGCVAPLHIRWATRQENMADKKLHGTSQCGEKHGMSKLTIDQVREIRRLLNIGLPTTNIATQFGVVSSTIRFIQKGETWVGI